jgi:two-component system, LuxR family, sensor kinase FixL
MLASQSMSKRDDTAFQALITMAADGIVVLDAQSHIRIFNPACERLFGYQPDEVIGKSVTVLIPSPYRDEPAGDFTQVSRETLGRRKDGATFPIAVSVGQGKMDEADITVAIIHDLTERGVAALLEAARLSAMGQMGATLAHEVNQPLAAVMNYVKAAQRTLEPSQDPRAVKATELLMKAGEQIARAGTIIRGLRDFIGRRALNRREEKLHQIIEEALAHGLAGADASNLRATVVLDPGLPAVLVDRVQIQQVVIDLIRNAVEAMRQVPDRHLTIHSSLAEGRLAQVTISDTGPGLSEGIAGRMFQPFVTTKENGMGLGLTICQSIINAHGGRLWVTPNEGAGVSVHFQLPLVEKTED